MSSIIQQVQKRMLVSLAQISKQLNIHEGDYLLIETTEDGAVLLRPVSWHDKSQEYFWSKEWQEKMKASEKDFDQGNYKTFDNVDDLLNDLGVDEEEEEKKDAETNSN